MRAVAVVVAVAIVVLGLVVFVLLSNEGEDPPTPAADPTDPATTADAIQLIDVGGHRLETVMKGQGSPAVIFDAGFIGGMSGWIAAQDIIAEHTMTLRYERAGLGGSDVGPEPRSAEQIALELHTLLANLGVSPPLVLVGHPAGGAFVRVYASLYPDAVAGVVLVDPATVEIWESLRVGDPERWDGFEEEVASAAPPPDWSGQWPPRGFSQQWRALPITLDQLRQSWPLPAVPTVVLTAMVPIPTDWPFETPEDMEFWLETHETLLGKLPGADHIVLPDADHISILDESILHEKILEVVEQVRRGEAR